MWTTCKPCAPLVGMQNGTAAVENSMVIPTKLKTESPYDPPIQPLGIYPLKLKAGSQRDICTTMFTVALFTIAKRQKQPKHPSMKEWINKTWHKHTWNVI